MTKFKCSDKSLRLMLEAANNYSRIIADLNEQEKSPVGLNAAESKLRFDVTALLEQHRMFTVEMMVDNECSWESIAEALNLTVQQVHLLVNRNANAKLLDEQLNC